MVDPHLYLAFAAAVTLLMLIPGPNVALIVANSLAYGPRYGLLTVAGTSSAMLLQLGATASGMARILGTLGGGFDALRWIGVLYLLYLGTTRWRAPAVDLTTTHAEPKSALAIYRRALLVALTNPKTLLFYGAFFPQFIESTRPIVPQIGLLSLMFLMLAVLIDGAWALAAGRVRGLLVTRGRWRNRISGGLLMGAGAALALAHKR